ncbi:TPA: DUF3265 domain-containing protein [Vibrio vulnificus]|nr:DUF3265 domain-containing protein [Vibrio vulnificus]
MKLKHNKAFKWDSCRVAFLVCGELCGESGLREVGLCGIHPLTQRYAMQKVTCLVDVCRFD